MVQKGFFETFLGTAVVNAWYIHSRVTRKKVQMLRFREALISGIVTKETDEEENSPTSGTSASAAGRNSKQKHQLSKY